MTDRSTRWILWAKPEEGEEPERAASAAGRQELFRADPPRPRRAPPPVRQTAPAGGEVAPLDLYVSNGSGASGPAGTPRVHPVGHVNPEIADLLDRIISDRLVEVLYQPLIDTVTDQVVGFEALSRGPKGPLEFPDRLFAAARALGRAGELDWVARAAAFRGFIDATMDPTMTLLVNVERDSLISPCPDELLDVIWEAESKLRVCVDVAGRSLSRHPREVLETVRRARAARWGVALDDLEISLSGLSLLPVLEPDVIKVSQTMLDTGMVGARTAFFAALAESERTGATTIIEQVEDETAKATAMSAGARYMQGYLFGKPAPLPAGLPKPRHPLRLLAPAEATSATPFTLAVERGLRVSEGITIEGVRRLVVWMSQSATDLSEAPFLATVLPAEIDRAAFAMVNGLLERAPLAVVLGADVSTYEDWSVRVANLPAEHPMRNERCHISLSNTSGMMIVARQTVPDRWDVAVSQDPVLCRDAVRLVLGVVDELEGGVRHGG